MKSFYTIVINSLVATITTSLVWFALSIWIYLETRSVLATGVLSGIILVAWATTGIWFGSLVDHYKKKTVMILSSSISFCAFIAGFLIYINTPAEVFHDSASIQLWVMAVLLFVGVIAGNIRAIALPTLVTLMVPEKNRDNANGLVGMINGVSYLVAPIVGGFLLAASGMYWVLILSILLMILVIIHLYFTNITEKGVVHTGEQQKKIDLIGTFKVVKTIPGLLALIIFNTINNFLGGVFMPLIDPYGLSLVNQQTWGVISGVLSVGFILGGLFIAKKGLGTNPLKTLFFANIIMWVITIFFTIQPWIILLALGFLTYTCLVPFIEASEQTIIQKVVPVARQGRVFGFAQSVEMSASPITAFAIGPIAQFFFIPLMQEGGLGANLIGSWFGVGDGRGIALVFSVVGIIGLVLTLLAMRTKAYRLLSKQYRQK